MNTTMRAVRLHEINGQPELRLDKNVPVPTPGAGEVLLAVRACGLNQVDLLTRDGLTPQKPPMPHISGTEVAGDVVQVGPGVTHVAVGDRVYGLGVFGLATESMARAGDVRIIPFLLVA